MASGSKRHAPAVIPTGKKPNNCGKGRLWASAPVWTGAENFAATGIRTLDRPTHSEPLYRLRYPGPWKQKKLPEHKT